MIVRNEATEVHGTESHRTGGGFGSYERCTRTYLNVGRQATVLGQLVRQGDELAVVKDDAVGMLLSGNEPSVQARHESYKGWACVVGGPILWILGSVVVHAQWVV